MASCEAPFREPIKDSDCIPNLISLLRDPNEEVRRAAVDGMLDLGHQGEQYPAVEFNPMSF